LPEVAGDAALCVDPRSVDALRSGLERLLEDEPLRARLTQAGQRRERDFDWTRTAQQTLETYRCAIAAGARPPGRATP
jgi:glycosyltransferase involved in cell wall biosynthesis